MRSWTAARLAVASGTRVLTGAQRADGPTRATVDSRAAGPGDLFVGLPGRNGDGGAFAADALAAGVWGVLVGERHGADASVAAARQAEADPSAAERVVLVSADPLQALGALAREWRRALSARVVAITGSTGKTSTKDILAALLSTHLRTVASSQNLNTEIGLPLAILEAPPGTEALVLELAMRGPGQIAELTAIAEPDLGVIVNIGPVHLELLGSMEAVAAAKAELIAGLRPEATIVIPVDEPLLDPHHRSELTTITFGPGGDVQLVEHERGSVVLDAAGERLELRPSFSQAHNLNNLLAAVAAARAIGVRPQGRLDVTFSALRGERIALPGQIVIVNDCYNANPMSMRAALDDLAATAHGRRVAVLGDMLELGPDERLFHAEVGAHARACGVDLLIAVGPLAAEMRSSFGPHCRVVADAAQAAAELPALLRPADTVLVKGSRGVGLEVVAEALADPATANPATAPRTPGSS